VAISNNHAMRDNVSSMTKRVNR